MRNRSKFIFNYLIVLITVLLTLSSTCDSKNHAPINTTYTLADNERVSCKLSEGHSLRIEVSVTGESRCPVGIDCFWAGYVKVTFNFKTPDPIDLYKDERTPDSVDLYKYVTGDQKLNRPNSYSFVVEGEGYTLTLNDVTPYPTTENQNEKKHVEFTLTQR